MNEFDFKGINERLLSDGAAILAGWFPNGRARGDHFAVGNLQGDKGDSLSISLVNGMWIDHATKETGGDLIDLYAACRGVSVKEAVLALGGASERAVTNGHGRPAPAQDEPDAVEAPFPPPPVPRPHPSWGSVTQTWAYYGATTPGPLFQICRFGEDRAEGQAKIRPLTWRGGRWRWKAYPAPRPLYWLPEILAQPELPVLIVEGEKCADAAYEALKHSWAVTTWAGGANASKATDFEPLRGRAVTIWPDADEPGRRAAAELVVRLRPIAASIQVLIIPAEHTEGWDCADAVSEGLDLQAFIAAHARTPAEPQPTQKPKRETRAQPAHAQRAAISGDAVSSAFVSWESLGIETSSGGAPHVSLGNVVAVLGRHPELKGRIWRDDFRGRIFHTLRGDPKPWTDADALRLTAWFNQTLRLPKFGISLIHSGVELCAAENARNSVTDWLLGLRWDGIPRLDTWLETYLGADHSALSTAIGANWIISMVARAFRPGCQADHMPVLEGLSGAGKSSAISILGGEWYRAAPQAFGSKEFYEVCQGSWLIEIPDMAGFGRREHGQIIAAITTRADTYRASYGRNAEDHPRTVIFAATSETDEYLADARGKRRYWPVTCGVLSLTELARDREQLFAEAVSRFEAGHPWHVVPIAEAREQQSSRENRDIWEAKIREYVAGKRDTTTSAIAQLCLDIPVWQQNDSHKTRIGKILQRLGYVGKVERVGASTARVYRLP